MIFKQVEPRDDEAATRLGNAAPSRVGDDLNATTTTSSSSTLS
jgi:hypothetical protein